HAAAVVANSRNSARLLESWGVVPARITVVHPGVDPDRFHPGVDGATIRRSIATADEVVFLSVGRLQRRKGHDLVLQALAHLRGVAPEIRYVIAGDGPERADLEQLSRTLGVDERVRFIGAIPDADL